MSNRTRFHKASIGGIDFEAHLSADGPYITAKRGRCELRGVALGDATSVAVLGPKGHKPAGAWIVKYRDERRIHLEGFGADDLAALNREFGIGDAFGGLAFFQSRAWDSLVGFTRTHPRIARQCGEYDNYLSGWYKRAVGEIQAQPLAA